MKNLKFTAVFILLVFCLTGCSNRVENEEMTLSFFDKDLKGKFSGTLKAKALLSLKRTNNISPTREISLKAVQKAKVL